MWCDTDGDSKKNWIVVGMIVFTGLSALVFMTIFSDIRIYQLPDIIWRFFAAEKLTAPEKIILYMRLPAIVMALLAGIGLSVSGGVMQSITHNDLVSPFTLGISAAAAFGASFCIIFSTGWLHTYAGRIVGAFFASCLCLAFVYGLAAKTGIMASTLVLTGIAMNYLFSAMSATIQFFAQEYRLGEIIQWTFGSFQKANWTEAGITAGVLLLGTAVYYVLALPLDAMAVNDDETVVSLGINPTRIRLWAGSVAVLLTATIISFTGVIGFVGLIAPHIARLVVGSEHRIFLPMAAVTGACLLLYSDMVGKYILYPVAIPVGIVISFLGVPLFVHLIIASRRRGN